MWIGTTTPNVVELFLLELQKKKICSVISDAAEKNKASLGSAVSSTSNT